MNRDRFRAAGFAVYVPKDDCPPGTWVRTSPNEWSNEKGEASGFIEIDRDARTVLIGQLDRDALYVDAVKIDASLVCAVADRLNEIAREYDCELDPTEKLA